MGIENYGLSGKVNHFEQVPLVEMSEDFSPQVENAFNLIGANPSELKDYLKSQLDSARTLEEKSTWLEQIAHFEQICTLLDAGEKLSANDKAFIQNV